MYKDEYLPCFAERGCTGYESTKEQCLESIDKALYEWFNRKSKGVLVISITDKDKYKDQWVEAIAEYNDVACVTTMSLLHGDYECKMFCIPVFQNLGRV